MNERSKQSHDVALSMFTPITPRLARLVKTSRVD